MRTLPKPVTPDPPRPRWEYKAIELDFSQLNTLGAEGWEFVTVLGSWMIFKRKRDERKTA